MNAKFRVEIATLLTDRTWYSNKYDVAVTLDALHRAMRKVAPGMHIASEGEVAKDLAIEQAHAAAGNLEVSSHAVLYIEEVSS